MVILSYICAMGKKYLGRGPFPCCLDKNDARNLVTNTDECNLRSFPVDTQSDLCVGPGNKRNHSGKSRKHTILPTEG